VAILCGAHPAAILGALDPPEETLIYRTEVLAIISALADLVVYVNRIRRILEDEDDDEEEEAD
jgi:hypothetical protein